MFCQLFICEVKDTQLLSTCLAFNSSQAKFVIKMQISLMEACNTAESFSLNSRKESCMSLTFLVLHTMALKLEMTKNGQKTVRKIYIVNHLLW